MRRGLNLYSMLVVLVALVAEVSVASAQSTDTTQARTPGLYFQCVHKIEKDARGPASFELYLHEDTLLLKTPSGEISRGSFTGQMVTMSRQSEYVKFVGFDNLLGDDYSTTVVVPAGFLQGQNSEVRLEGRGDGFITIPYICQLVLPLSTGPSTP